MGDVTDMAKKHSTAYVLAEASDRALEDGNVRMAEYLIEQIYQRYDDAQKGALRVQSKKLASDRREGPAFRELATDATGVD